MPGNYKRTSTRKSWSHEDMELAIKAVRENRMGWLLASKRFNVPQATLRRHFYSVPVNLGRFKPTFNADMEKALVEHILEFESRLFGFNTTEIRKLAFDFAEKLGLDHRFDKNAKTAGWDWLKGFRDRNPNITLRAPEPTSAARAKAFNKPQVMKFFSLLEETVTANGIEAHRIYNMDESGLNTVQKPPKVFASKGKKQVGAVTSDERGQHFTVVVCANAIGNFVPPAIIIPRKNYKAEYFDGAPPGTLQLCYPTGYMVGDLFLKWMRHFVAFVNASLTNKVLLILDGHSSHKNLEALEFAKANGVIMLCFPPHCTHRMQPTDVSFFGPLKAYYDREMATWMKNHPGRTVGLYQVANIFGLAYTNAASVRNITSGFEKTGIYPFNPNIFPEDLFLPSEVTENVLNNDEPVASCTSQVDENLINDEEPVASSSSQREQNRDDSDSTDAEEEVVMRNLSPSILHSNVATHELTESGPNKQNNLNELLHVAIASNKDATPQEVHNNPLSLMHLTHLVVKNLLHNHDVNISPRLQPTLLESGAKNATKEMDATVASFDTNILAGQLHLPPEVPLPRSDSILKEISPLPKAASKGTLRANRKVGGSKVFTASPFMNEIKAAVQQKKEKENRIALKKQTQTKRVIFEADDVETKTGRKQRKSANLHKDNKVDPQSVSKKGRSTRNRKQRQSVVFDDDDDQPEDPYANEEGDDDAACIYCNELFSNSRPKEHWVKCQLCSNWCHTLCAGIPAKMKQFICELCS